MALIDADAGGSGNFANGPTASTVLFFQSGFGAGTGAGGNVVINVPMGFGTGFSFYYSSRAIGSVTVYDALDGGGNILGSINLVANYAGNNCTGDLNGTFCNWDPIGIGFSGIAKSAILSGVVDEAGFDGIYFGSAVAGDPSSGAPGQVPEPATLALMGLGLVGFGFQRRQQDKLNNRAQT